MQYSGDGTLNFGGSAEFCFVANKIHKYPVGSMLYSRPKALKGLLEMYYIKKVKFVSHIQPVIYVDTFNAYHNEEDLMWPGDAMDLVEEVLDQMQEDLEDYITDCDV